MGPGGMHGGMMSGGMMGGTRHRPPMRIQAYQNAADKMYGPMIEGLQANDPDVAFVRAMVAHRQGAIELAKVRVQFGKDEQTRKWADDIIRDQQAAIEEMATWLGKGSSNASSRGQSDRDHKAIASVTRSASGANKPIRDLQCEPSAKGPSRAQKNKKTENWDRAICDGTGYGGMARKGPCKSVSGPAQSAPSLGTGGEPPRRVPARRRFQPRARCGPLSQCWATSSPIAAMRGSARSSFSMCCASAPTTCWRTSSLANRRYSTSITKPSWTRAGSIGPPITPCYGSPAIPTSAWRIASTRANRP